MGILVDKTVYEGVQALMICILPQYDQHMFVEWWRQTDEDGKQNILSATLTDGQVQDQGRLSNFNSLTTDDKYHKIVLNSPTAADAGQYWCEVVVDGEKQVSGKVTVNVES